MSYGFDDEFDVDEAAAMMQAEIDLDNRQAATEIDAVWVVNWRELDDETARDENVNLIWDRVVTLNGDHPSSSQMCDDVVSDGLLSCGPVGVDRGQ